MFYVVLYLGFSYLAIALLIIATRRWGARCRRPYLACALVLLLLPLLPYLRVEINTALHLGPLMPAVRQSATDWSFNGEVKWAKVMRISDRSAEVLVVMQWDRNKAADVVKLVRRRGRWCFDGDYATVWSSAGSADGNTFPPYCMDSE